MNITITQIIDRFTATPIGHNELSLLPTHEDGSLTVTGLASLDEAQNGDLTFAENLDRLKELKHSLAVAAFVPLSALEMLSQDHCQTILIPVKNPQACFLELLTEFRQPPRTGMVGIDPRAIISPSARIGHDCTIYPNVFIDAQAVIGDRCVLHPGVTIGPGCQLGNDVTLYPHVVLYAQSVLGDRVTIHAHAVIGADGFGYRFEAGAFQKLPHMGSVQIDHDVEIGACTTIDRAMIGKTIIGTGTKIDNLVMVAHNCQVGRHNVYASQVGLAGSVTTGDYVRMGGQSGIKDHIRVGNQVSISACSGLMHDVEDGQTVIGQPAGPEKTQKKILMSVQRLPEMRDQLKALARRIELLEKQNSPSSEPIVKAA